MCHICRRREIGTGFWWGNLKEEGRKPRGGSRREDNIKIDLEEGVKWTG